uniref:Gag-Pol polyprotein n=1 Tax=Tanacetum cinerariifolium TaxID=118510 RepID=A0A6L2M9Y2_TANCI|nr:hypothetical protein [Tanacetum cinerariifolium]
MSRDVLTVGSTMRIPLLYRGEYLQWVERFMNYLEEQTDGEAMINSIKKGDQALPRVTQVSITRTSSTKQHPLKDKSMWHMLGSEYGEQDRQAAVLYEYETFKATEGELLLDTYIQYLQVINDSKKCGYSKDNCELNFKFLNNLQPEWNNVNDAMGSKKKTVVVTSDPLALIVETTKVSKSKEKEGHFAKDCKKIKVKDYEYYMTKMMLAKKDKDKQVLLAEDQAWMESSSDSDQDINANLVFMAQIEKVLSDSETSSSPADEKISEKHIEKANQQSKDFENQNKDLQDKYDVLKNQTTTFEINNKELNEQLKELIEMNNDLLDQTKVLKEQLQVKHVVIDTHVECQEKYAKLEAERYEMNDLLDDNNFFIFDDESVKISPVSKMPFRKKPCDSKMNDFLDDNNFFIFDDESVKISPVSKMPFRKKPCDSMRV